MTHDIRWIQRFQHYQKALARLEEAVTLAEERSLSDLERQGLIQAFEFTHELAWKTLKDFLEYHGVQDLYGSKDVTRAAFQAGLLKDAEVWMNMIVSRNLTVHTYNETTAKRIAQDIQRRYYPCFVQLRERMEELVSREDAS